MRKFYFTIVDDDSGDQGYGRFLKLLKQKNYIKSVGNISNSKETKGECWTESINFKVYTADYGDALLESFCDAYSRFKNENDVFDFYVFDLKFDKEMFLPTADDNICDQAKLYVKNLSATDIEVGRKSYQLAGLDFFNCVEINNKPKIILSAATQTVTLRTTFKLIDKRLRDVFVIDNDPGTHLDDSNAQVNGAFDAIDTYLQSRQIEIINRQSPEKIKALSDIITSWSKNSVPKADEPLIPDDGENEDDKENCWSLRTLFPKQVNRIELGMELGKNKEDILECLNNLSFPAIYDWLVHHHGNIKGEEYANIKLGKVVQDRFASLPSFAFTKSDKIPYKDFAEIVNYENYDFKSVRDCIYTQTKFKDILPENQLIKENCGNDITEEFKLSVTNKHNSPAIRQMAEYGLYLGDLKLFYDIIESNAKYNFSDEYKNKNTHLPKPKLILDYCNNTLMVSISYDSDHEFFKSAKENLKPVHEKIKVLLTDRNSWSHIDQLGPSQIFKILAYRYKAPLEVRIGQFSFSANRDSVSEITENYQDNATYFRFKLNKVSNL